MTQFISHYNLCAIPDPKELLGIAADCDKENIILTLGKNIALVTKPSTQKPVRSWSVLEKLSSKVVYDFKSKKYVGVFTHDSLRCWDEDELDVNKCKKLKFEKRIVDLVSTNEDTIVLFTDGSCKELSQAIKSRNERSAHLSQQANTFTNYNYSDAQVVTYPDGQRVLIYFQRQPDNNKQLKVVQQKLSDDTKASFNITRGGLDAHIAGYAVIEGEHSPVLLTIWSDKRIFLLNMNDDIQANDSLGKFIGMIPILNTDKLLSIIGISQNFVAIYGANSTQEGSSLLLYNTQFRVIKAKQFFKVYFDISKLWGVNEHILLAMGQNLSVISYRIQKELLSDLIGTQCNNNFQTPVHEDINEEDPLQECIELADTALNTNKQKVDMNKPIVYNVEEADGKTVPFESSENFDRLLAAVNKLHMHVETLEIQDPTENGQVTLMSNCNDKWFVTKEVKIIARQLESCGASEHEITEKLLPLLIKVHLLEDIAVCLCRYSNISEKMLARTLKYLLDKFASNDKTKVNGVPEKMDMDESDDESKHSLSKRTSCLRMGDETHVKVLNFLIACTFQPKSLVMHLREEITYSQVVLLLEHLYDLMLTGQTIPHIAPEDFDMQVLSWVNVLLDAHFQSLALSKDFQLLEIFVKWHELYTRYKQEVFELEHISALLYNIIQRKKTYKEKNYSKLYSIEEIVIDIGNELA